MKRGLSGHRPRILPKRDPPRPADGRAGRCRFRSSSSSSPGTSRTTRTGRPPSSSSRWPPTRSTAGSRAAAESDSALGSLLDPIADKVLVLAALVMLVGEGVAPAWMIAPHRRRASSSSRVCGSRRSSGASCSALATWARLKTWAQAIAVGRRRASPPPEPGATASRWWALLVALVADLGVRARLRAVAPRVLRGESA